MKNGSSLKYVILKHQITNFIKFFSLFLLGLLLFIKFTGEKLGLEHFIMFSAIISFFSVNSEFSNTTHLISLFYQRKSTRHFLKDLIEIKIVTFLIYFLITLTTAFVTNIVTFDNLLEKFSIGSIIFSFIIIFYIFVFADFLSLVNIYNQKNNSVAKNDFKKAIFGILSFVFYIFFFVNLFSISRASGFTFILLSINFIIFQIGFMQNILAKKLRIKYLISISSLLVVISIFIGLFEYQKGNTTFVFDLESAKQSYRMIVNPGALIETKELTINDAKTFYSWTKWMEQETQTNETYVESFKILPNFCPPDSKRLDPLNIKCNSCVETYYSIGADTIEIISLQDREKRMNMLFDLNSEYGNMMGMIYSLYVKDISNETKDKIHDISQDLSSPLQGLAVSIIQNRTNASDNIVTFSSTKAPCKKR